MVKKLKNEIFIEHLREAIDNYTYPFGSVFPSERDLAERYSLNRSTVRKAIEQLVNEEYLKKVPGKGTYVIKNSREDLQIHFKGMSELLKDSGFTPFSSIVAYEKCKVGYKLSQIFNIDENKELFRIIRLRGGNNIPVSIEDTYVPCDLVPDIENIDFQIFSLYDILASHSIQIEYINHIISTEKVRNNEARLLNLNDGETVISLLITSYSQTHQVIEHTKVLVVSDFCSFYTDTYVNNKEVTVYAQSD